MEKRIDKAQKFLRLVRLKCGENSPKYKGFLELMKAYKEQRYDIGLVCSRVQEIFFDDKRLLQDFNKLIPVEFRIPVSHRPKYSEALNYIKQVKLQTETNPSVYLSFTHLLKLYQSNKLPLNELHRRVLGLFSGFPELVQKFTDFIPQQTEETDEEPSPQIPKKPSVSAEVILRHEIKDPIPKNLFMFFRSLNSVLRLNSEPGTDYYLELVRSLHLYCECVITKSELVGMVIPIFKITSVDNFIVHSQYGRRSTKEVMPQAEQIVKDKLEEYYSQFKEVAASREVNRRKQGWFFRPLTEFCSDTKKHGRSYLAIQRPRIRKPRPAPLINNEWISVPYGREDYNFEHFRKNIFEYNLFKCEDERYLAEMEFEGAAYTLELLKKAYSELESLPASQRHTYKIEKAVLTPFRMKHIKSIYGVHGNKLVHILQANPSKALPAVIKRVETKIKTYRTMIKAANEQLWGETIEKNFLRSLDHRSFYFKQNEKKMIKLSNLLSQAKERLNLRTTSSEEMKSYLNGSKKENYFFQGGSQHKYFYSSLEGLSNSVTHKVSTDFKDELHQEFVDSPGMLPHFRLLFNYKEVLNDSIRIILVALKHSNISEKEKVLKWVMFIFKDFLKVELSEDIQKDQVESYLDNLYAEVSTKKIINKWINPEVSSESEDQKEPINLRKDESFSAFLPLLKDNSVIYCTSSVYCFIRYFYILYERLIKVKMILNKQNKHTERTELDYGDYQFSQEAQRNYMVFLKATYGVLKSPTEMSTFEDKCRELLENEAYLLFTFDKLVSNCVRSLNSIVSDEFSENVQSIFTKFSRHRLNEEMYYTEFYNVSAKNEIFRLHWNPKVYLLSVTYITSPYQSIPETAIKPARKYAKSYINTCKPTLLENQLQVLQKRLDWFYHVYQVYPSELSSQVDFSNKLTQGLCKSYKFTKTPSQEDFLYNTEYYTKTFLVSLSNRKLICQDKNSYVQALEEHRSGKLEKWMSSN